MKQGISPAVAVVAILVVVVVACAIGYFGFLRPKGGTGNDVAPPPDQMQEQPTANDQSSQPMADPATQGADVPPGR